MKHLSRRPERGADRRRRWRCVVAGMLVLSPWCPGSAGAAPIVTGIHRTGLAESPSTLRRAAVSTNDPYWRVAALPEAVDFESHHASVFSGRGPSLNVPPAWFHGSEGYGGAGWIGLRPATTRSLYAPNIGAQSDYTTIYATTFFASEAGSFAFDLTATADNGLTFFVNGDVTDRSTLMPSIAGGTRIGAERVGLGRLHRFQGVADVRAGENILYAVVRDRYTLDPLTNIGGYGRTGLMVTSVPESGTLVMLLSGGLCAGLGAGWRRLRAALHRRREAGQRGSADARGV